ncbi:MAG TPA: histidine kinase [Isosphaeraceae bacterium]|nr:histidine kinase [Isosphaeraceae bacterium]
MGVESRRGWSRLALPAAVSMTALSAGLLVAWVALVVAMPTAVPSDDTAGQLLLALPLFSGGVIAFLLTARRPENPVGWLLGGSMVVITILLLGNAYGDHWLYAPDLPGALVVPLGVIGALGWAAGFPALLVVLPLVFPDGHLLSRRWRPLVWLAAATAIMAVIASSLDPAAMGDGHRQVANPLGLSGAHDFLNLLLGPVYTVVAVPLMVAAVVSLGIRYRRADSALRHQLKWFIAAASVAVVAMVVALVTQFSPLGFLAITIGFTALPVSIGIAVLRYRLYDIDVVISRALVYGALAAFITAVYVGIVVGIGTLVGGGGRPNLVLSILATAIVAVGFQPVRERVQKVANRLVYGKRATPYEVLSEFSGRVAESYAGGDVLKRMAQVLQEGTGAEAATVWLRGPDHLDPAATHPDTVVGYEPIAISDGILPDIPNASRAVPVRHQDEVLGVLTLVKRRGEALTPIEEKLVTDLAHQAGLVLKNVGLTADLQRRLEELRASRQRLVAAQDEERRRLERNLHDGAQQNLVAIKVKLGLAEMMTTKDPAKAGDLISSLKADTDEALDTLRDLARGIYPPLLADQGLKAALESQTRKATLPVIVEPDGIDRYPQEVEAAVYFCVLEALQNVQKYAHATTAVVRLSVVDDQLRFEVSDDGMGFDQSRVARGSGLTNMADRIDALEGHLAIASEAGGFTRVSGIIPLHAATAVA